MGKMADRNKPVCSLGSGSGLWVHICVCVCMCEFHNTGVHIGDDKWPDWWPFQSLSLTHTPAHGQFSTPSALHLGADTCSHGNTINRAPTRVSRVARSLPLSPLSTGPDIWRSVSRCTCSSLNIFSWLYIFSFYWFVSCPIRSASHACTCKKIDIHKGTLTF